MIENEIIPFLPYAPSTDHEQIHEVWTSKVVVLMLQQVKNDIFLSPLYTDGVPSGDAWRAVKEQVQGGLINLIMA